MAREIGSWLSGPQSIEPDEGYPGERLGLPEQGPGSVARTGRRLVALILDWSFSYGLAGLALSIGVFNYWFLPTAVLLIWFTLGVISVRFFGFTPGQYLLGMKVASIDHRVHVGSGRAAARGLLLALIIPALFNDGDGRGIQDRATATAVVRR